MTRKFSWLSAILVIMLLSLSIVSWAQEEAKKPDYLKEKERIISSEKTRHVELRTSNEPTREYIKVLNKELGELKAKLRQLPPDKDDEARDYQKRIAEIQREITQLKRRRSDDLAEAKAKRENKAVSEKRLSSAEAQRRIERLRDDIKEAKENIQELKRTNPDSPRLKELKQHIAERERTIKNLTAQLRRKRAPQRSKRPIGQTRLEIFTLNNIDVESAFKIVREFITDGQIVPVIHTNSLIIRDTQQNLRDIGTIIEHIDVKGRREDRK